MDENVFIFGDAPAEGALVVPADLVLGPYYINRGTSYDPSLELAEDTELDLNSLRFQIQKTMKDLTKHRVVFFDDLEDCARYYRDSMKYYAEPEPVRVAGFIKEIDLEYKTAKVEIKPNAIFKHPENDLVQYRLYIRGLTEWKEQKIYFTDIYAYDLVLVEEGGLWRVK